MRRSVSSARRAPALHQADARGDALHADWLHRDAQDSILDLLAPFDVVEIRAWKQKRVPWIGRAVRSAPTSSQCDTTQTDAEEGPATAAIAWRTLFVGIAWWNARTHHTLQKDSMHSMHRRSDTRRRGDRSARPAMAPGQTAPARGPEPLLSRNDRCTRAASGFFSAVLCGNPQSGRTRRPSWPAARRIRSSRLKSASPGSAPRATSADAR